MKRKLSLIFILVLLVSILSIGTFSVTASAATIVESGTCGDNLTWTLDNKGTLTISGTGDMYDYSVDNYSQVYVPWMNCRESILSVIIQDGVTTVGDFAFVFCSNLTGVSISNSVASVGDYSFYACSNLTNINIPNGIISIGDFAFSSCRGLTNLIIPDGVINIGEYAFTYCDGLTQVLIPKSVTSIGYGVFGRCNNLICIKVDENNIFYKDIDGNLYSKDGSLLLAYAAGKKETKFAIPDDVTVIASDVFSECSNLTIITIPNGVTSIGNYAFSYCGLTSVIIPNEITDIAEGLFQGCRSLTNVIIPQTVGSIGDYAFYYCDGLTSVVIPNSITSIGYDAFGFCDNLANVWYTGNSEQKEHISIGQLNYDLIDAQWHYNYDYDTCIQSNSGNHTYMWVVDKENNCITDGIQHEECILCFHKQNQNTILPANGNHSLSELTDRKCNVCEQDVILVKYDHNDGANVTQTWLKPNDSTTIPSEVPTRSGYNFTGWSTTKGGDVEYHAGDTLSSLSKSIILYAQWNKHCSLCEGDGIEEYSEKCWYCSGKGTIQSTTKCSNCDGDGKIEYTTSVTCTTCNGTGKGAVYDATCGWCAGYGGYFTYKCSSGHVTESKYRLYSCKTCGSYSITETIHKCSTCGGYGTVKSDKCKACDGDGSVSGGQSSYSCYSCSGTGYANKDCSYCISGYIDKTRSCTSCDGTGEVVRLNVAAPSIPVIENIDGNTITLKAIANCEYSMDGIYWQDSPIFDNLDTDIEYHFYQRYAKTDTTFASGASEALKITICSHKQIATAVVENKVDATCTADGSYDSVIYCSICGAELSRETKITPILGHDYENEWTIDVEPTCTTVGSKSHHCTRCDDKADITEVPANGHNYGDWYTITAPTCTATGTDEHECSVCHNKETRTTDAKGHTNAAVVVENKVDATCIADGSYDNVIYCSVCRAEVSREAKTESMLGHNYETKWTTDVEPTCTTVGIKSHHCTRCGDKADVTEISANGHSYGEWYETHAPTCIAAGKEEHECSVCHNKETRTTDAKGHTNSEAVVENKIDATCSTDGSYDSVIYCSVCNTELSREAKTDSMLGHDYSNEWTTDVEPTCTTVGSKSHHCTRCDDKSDVTEVPANGHSYLTDFVFDEANHWKECACGEKNEITAHTWNNGEVTKEATVDEEGIKTYTCTLCSCTKNESIAKLVTNVKDTESGVTLEIPSNSQATLPTGTVIEVVEKSNESISEQILGEFAATAETVVEALGVYDLNLLLDGVKIQPNGAVVVTLPAPKFTAEYDRIIVVFIADDGSYDECKTTVNADGTISFETHHFSKYAVIGVNEEEADDRIGVGAIIAIVVGAVLVVGGGAFAIYWFAIKKKAKSTEENTTATSEVSADIVDGEQK